MFGNSYDGKVYDHSLHPQAPRYKEPGNTPSTYQYLQCPLAKAPRCFRTALIRSLELGEGNFIPTNWRGFSDYFRLQEFKARSAEDLVEAWADRHPYKQEHTLQKVIEYAQSTQHAKLLQQFDQILKGECIDHLAILYERMKSNAQC